MNTNNIFHKIKLYNRERFPIIAISLFCISISIGLSSISPQYSIINIILNSIFLVLLLLHMRILDEFKDYKYDNKNHPDRPVQSGKISLQELKIVGIINITALSILSLYLNPNTYFLIFIFVIFYSLLMYKEFFIQNFYEKSPLAYLISHQFIFVPTLVFLLLGMNVIINIDFFLVITFLIIPIILVELGRKIEFRYDEKGNKTTDSYAFVWGQKKTIFATIILVLLALAIIYILYGINIGFLILLSILLFLIITFIFKFNLLVNYSKLIYSLISIIIPLLLVL